MADAPQPQFIPTPGSSNIAGYAYDASTDTLTISFTSGDDYHFLNVPPAVVRDFGNSGSKGQFFHRQIKGRYGYEPL